MTVFRCSLLRLLLLSSLILFLCRPTQAQDPDSTAFSLVDRLSAEEANQAVAVDANHVYAITNREIGKYEKETGERVDGWSGAEDGPIIHLNSGVVIDDTLYCAHSNYPGTPMVSSIEMWDVRTMTHVGSHSFGIDQGSATWVDRRDGHWWVAFAHYGRRVHGGPSGGAAGKGPDWTTLVKYGPNWTRREGFIFPTAVIDRMRPYSTSGGAWGPDDRLYVTGHDKTEVYVLDLPSAGSTLRLLDTADFPGEGQGIAWDPARPDRLYGIQRSEREVVVTRMAQTPDSSQ